MALLGPASMVQLTDSDFQEMKYKIFTLFAHVEVEVLRCEYRLKTLASTIHRQQIKLQTFKKV